VTYPVLGLVFPHPPDALRVEVVAEHVTALLRRWDCERPDSGHDIRDDAPDGEEVDEPVVLVLQARVPVHLGEVKGEVAPGFGLA
jgi:hypothetical protein